MHYTDKEVLKLALEALESADWYINQLEITLYSEDDAGTHEDRLKVQESITAIKQALAAPVQEPVSGYIKKIEDLIQERDDARSSRDFYKRRADAIQQWQSKMRDPERTIVCDILANGHTLEPAGDRYTPPAAQPAMRQVGVVEPLMGTMRTVIWDEGTIPSAGTTLWAKDE